MVISVKQLAGAIRKKRPQIEEQNAGELAIFYMNFFGFYGRILDNVLVPEERDAFYQLEDMGLVTTKSEKTDRPYVKCVNGRYGISGWKNWTIIYWILKEGEITRIEKNKPEESEIEKGGGVYSDESVWKQAREARKSFGAGKG